MKKIALLLLPFCFVFIFYSCNKDAECWQAIAKGIIQKQGATTYMYETHVLTDNNGKTLDALKSETINLDNYINKYVEIQGQKYNPGLGGPDYIDVTSLR